MHVVAAVERRLLLDLTLDRCSSPEHEVELPPGLFNELPPTFLRGGRVQHRVNGCDVVYEAHPEERGYLKPPDWTDRVRRQSFIDASLARRQSSR